MEFRTVALIGAGAIGSYFVLGMAGNMGEDFRERPDFRHCRIWMRSAPRRSRCFPERSFGWERNWVFPRPSMNLPTTPSGRWRRKMPGSFAETEAAGGIQEAGTRQNIGEKDRKGKTE